MDTSQSNPYTARHQLPYPPHFERKGSPLYPCGRIASISLGENTAPWKMLHLKMKQSPTMMRSG